VSPAPPPLNHLASRGRAKERSWIRARCVTAARKCPRVSVATSFTEQRSSSWTRTEMAVMRLVALVAACALPSCTNLCEAASDCAASSKGVQSICFRGIRVAAAPLGSPCTGANECESAHCVHGVCCDPPCNNQTRQRCDSYSVSGAGHCDVAQVGTDPAGQCPPFTSSCSERCNILTTSCACSGTDYTCARHQKTTPVASGSVCDSNAAAPVSETNSCSTGNDCADGKCRARRWWTSCDGKGSCRAASDATDAYTEAVIASAGHSLTSSCVMDGTIYCGAVCGASGVYWAFSDGASHCTSTSSSKKSDCGIYGCDASSEKCKSQCSADADCASPYLCAAPVCHRNWEWPSWRSNPRSFTKNSDGTVKDNVTGLVGQQGVSDSGKAWSDAKAYCAGLGLAGGGRRLPTRIELLTIIDVTKYMPAINTGVFSLGASSSNGANFWSATPTPRFRPCVARRLLLWRPARLRHEEHELGSVCALRTGFDASTS
jgi:hypothetical protein